MKIILIIIIFLGLVFPSQKEEKMIWNEAQKLTWNDFKGLPNGLDEFVASTNSGISFSISTKETNGEIEINYQIFANFYPQLSWYKPEEVTPYILAHEQTHFDISELQARKFRKALSEITKDRGFKDKASIIYSQIEAQRREMQKLYDAESDHSNRTTEENRWQEKVAALLEQLKEWK